MKIPTEEEIIEQAESIKEDIKERIARRIILNKINKLIRMLKKPVRRVDFKFLQYKKAKESLSRLRRRN